MTATVFDPSVRPSKRKTRRHQVVHLAAPPAHPAIGTAALVLAAAGLVAVVVLGIATETSSELSLPGGVTTFIGSLTGLVGMYLALLMVLIVARIPALERILGQDGMLRWHRRLAPWPISLLVAHAVFVTIGYAQAARTGAFHEIGLLVDNYPDMLAAVVGLGLMVAIGIVSIRALRERMRRETWWVVHLYMYLALALSFAHVIALGPAFVGHPVNRLVWSVVWAATAGTVLVYRFGLPLVRTLRHRLRVVEIHPEGPGVASVVLAGRAVDRLPVSGGQFIAWRFLTRGMWWQAHPYSLSALPRPPYLRLTVKQAGDHSAAVARLKPGTKVAIEGPYGALAPHARTHEKVLLVAGGIGITALRSLLEDLPRSADPVVVMRASSDDELVLKEEVAELVRQRRGTLHPLVGSREQIRFDADSLRRLVPDVGQRDVFVTGPPGLVGDVVAAARQLGVHRRALHYEVFSW
ncbi:MAG: ferredoxin reductase family protein [Acidimicrobiales bacterium]